MPISNICNCLTMDYLQYQRKQTPDSLMFHIRRRNVYNGYFILVDVFVTLIICKFELSVLLLDI